MGLKIGFKNNEEENNDLEGLKQSFIEVRELHDSHIRSIRLMRDVTKTFFSSCSILITIVVSLNIIFREINSIYTAAYNGLLIGLICAYILFVVLCIWNLIPGALVPPFPRDYEKITESLCIPAVDRYAMMVSAYLKSMELNTPIINKISNRLIASGVLYGLMVVIIIGLAMIP